MNVIRNMFWKRVRKSYVLTEFLIHGGIPVLPRRLAFLYRFIYPSRPIKPSGDGFEFGGRGLFPCNGGAVIPMTDRVERMLVEGFDPEMVEGFDPEADMGYIRWVSIRYADLRVLLVRDLIGMVYMKTESI